MAATYDLLGSGTVPVNVTPIDVENWEQVIAQAKPSMIVFYVRLPSILQDEADTDAILAEWAGWLNELGATAGVRDVLWVTDIDINDMYVDTLNITVVGTNTNLTTTLYGVPTEESVSAWQARVAAARAGLDALASA